MQSISSRNNTRAEPRRFVLYVEDDEGNRQVASLRLDKKYDLIFAATDAEACRVLNERSAELDLVLMDIELKGSRLNGIDLTRLARGQYSGAPLPAYAVDVKPVDIPILFVTAYGQQYRRAELIAAGADEIIHKPVDFVALHTTMARIYLQRLK